MKFRERVKPICPEPRTRDCSDEFTAKILKAIQGELNAICFYNKLLKKAKKKEDKRVIESIIADERTHCAYFECLYEQLTGKEPSCLCFSDSCAKPDSYCEGLEESALDELADSNFYRELANDISDDEVQDKILFISYQESKHATKFTLLRARCRKCH